MAKRIRSGLSQSGRTVSEKAAIDARQLAIELVEQMRATAAPKPTFKELADAWLAANSSRLVAPDNEWRHIRHMKVLWEMREGELTPTVIVAALGVLGLGEHTLNKVRSTGRRVIHAAMGDGKWGAVNLFAMVKRFNQDRPKFRVLSPEEILRILPHLREDRRRETKVSLFTGIRPGELLGMKKDQVELQARKIMVRRSHWRSTTKTGVWREIPIPEAVVGDLEAAIAESPSEYLFPRRDGTGRRQRHDTKLARTLRTAMGKAGLVQHYRYSCRRKGCGFKENRDASFVAHCPRCNFKLWIQPVPIRARFYDLRHTSATLHRQAGADPLAIKVTLGHARRDPTDDIYSHLTDVDLRREMNKLKLEARNAMATTDTESLGTSLGSLRSTTELPPQNHRPGVEPHPLLTVKDVAARLGVKKSTVYRLVQSGGLPVVRVGSLFRFRPRDVDAFVEGGGGQ